MKKYETKAKFMKFLKEQGVLWDKDSSTPDSVANFMEKGGLEAGEGTKHSEGFRLWEKAAIGASYNTATSVNGSEKQNRAGKAAFWLLKKNHKIPPKQEIEASLDDDKPHHSALQTIRDKVGKKLIVTAFIAMTFPANAFVGNTDTNDNTTNNTNQIESGYEQLQQQSNTLDSYSFLDGFPYNSTDDSTESLGPLRPAQDGPDLDQTDSGNRFDNFFDNLMEHEGGYSNHEHDDGGKTNFGVTERTLNNFMDAHGDDAGFDADSPDELTQDQAKQVYKSMFYDKYRVGEIQNDTVASMYFDMLVNHGPQNAGEMLQTQVNETLGTNMEVDGVVGSGTIKTLNTANSDQCVQINNGLVEKRQDFYQKIISRDDSKKTFEDGWQKRANSFKLAVNLKAQAGRS